MVAERSVIKKHGNMQKSESYILILVANYSVKSLLS
jgi:hypothetical protein